MAGSSASKKVARAARTGGGRRRSFNADFGFYAFLLGLALLGTLLVVFSRNERLTDINGGSPPRSQEAADGGDRWYAAYGFYICGEFAPPIDSPNNILGFSTQNDGIIYIHPFEREYSGSNANLGAFAEEVDFKIDRDSFTLRDEKYVDDETKCGEDTGQMVVKVWDDANDPESGEIREGDPGRILLKDGQAITVAFVADEDADIPLPPSVPTLAQAPAKDAASVQPQPGGANSADPLAGLTPSALDPNQAPAPDSSGATPAPVTP